MNRAAACLQIWLLALVVCAVLTALSFKYVDLRVAHHFWNIGRVLQPLNSGFGAAVVLSCECALTVGLVLTRLVRGHLSRLAATLVIACLASICTYAVNDLVLKPWFGVPVPAAVIAGAAHHFDFLSAPGNYSFPSGHMVLAASFAGVCMSLYRAALWPLAALLIVAAVLLVVGDWHFVSDVIAGGFVGLSAGLLAGGAWRLHSEQAS
ncbi:MAG TPA: phosphatase PAP2 family protein [Steroidobacteraceae bacterium]|nr:phosphatase PAP2 family protein [Steroidobacteraceae bacterium]